jgi:hypothetical protein
MSVPKTVQTAKNIIYSTSQLKTASKKKACLNRFACAGRFCYFLTLPVEFDMINKLKFISLNHPQNAMVGCEVFLFSQEKS